MLCIIDAAKSTVATAADIAATASHTLAHVLCLVVGFMGYWISGSIANSFILHSVIMSISRL